MSSYVVAGRPMGSGPDVAMYQPATNFRAVKLGGEDGGFIKATEGIGYLDPWFLRHAAAATAAGFPWGPYHFARPGNNAVREVNWFCDIILGTPGWTLPPVLDMEQPGTGQWVIDFCSQVRRRTGINPIIYTGAYVQYDRPAALTQWKLWIAAYNAGYSPDPNPEAIGQPPLCAPWGRDWVAWQYTSSATVAGVPGRCDRSVIDKNWLAAVTGQQPTPPVPEDDMPYTPEQLTAITVQGVTAASVFIARDPSDGGMYVFCRLSMDRRPLVNEDAVVLANTQLAIPFLRPAGESQDISPELVHLFAINADDAGTAVTLDPAALTGLVGQIAKAVADEEARRMAG